MAVNDPYADLFEAPSTGGEKVTIPGKPEGNISVRQNNATNLKYGGRPGETLGAQGYAAYATPEAGWQAGAQHLEEYKSKGYTLGQGADKWFRDPKIHTQKDVDSYTKDIVKLTGFSPDTPMSQIPTDTLVKAFAKRESGATKTGGAPASGDPYADLFQQDKPVSEKVITAENCGDLVAQTLNPKLQAAGLPPLDRHGLAIDTPEVMGRATGAPVYRQSETPFTAQEMSTWSPGTFMVGGTGGSDSHAQMVEVNPETGKKEILSFAKGKPYYKSFEQAERDIQASGWKNWTATNPLRGAAAAAGHIAAGGDPYADLFADTKAETGPPENPAWTGLKRGVIWAADQAARTIDPSTSLAMAGDYKGAGDYVWEHPHLNAFSPADRAVLTHMATDRLVNELWPNGTPPEPGFLGGMVRDAISMWPLFLEASSLAPAIGGGVLGLLGAGHAGNIMAGIGVADVLSGAALLGAIGATEEDPYKGAALMAGQGAGFGAMRPLTAALPFFTKFLARASGGAAIFGGLTAITGGSAEQIKRDAAFGLFMEVMGVPFEERAKAADAIPDEVKNQIRELAEKAEAATQGYGGTVPYERAKAGVDKAVMEFRTGAPPHQALVDVLPPGVLDGIREGEDLSPEYEKEVARRWVDLQQRDYPSATEPGKVEVQIGKGKRARTVERTSPAVEAFPADQKLTGARMEWITSAAARERQLEIDSMDWEDGKGVAPWKESVGDAEAREAIEARREVKKQQERLDKLKQDYEKEPVAKWDTLEPEESAAAIQDMIRDYHNGVDQPILSEVVPPDVLEKVREGQGLPSLYEKKIQEALAGGSFPGYGQWKQWESYLESQQRHIDAMAEQAKVIEEAEVAPMASPRYDKPAELPGVAIDTARSEVARQYGVKPDALVYDGVMRGPGDSDLAMFTVADPQSDRYRSPLSAKVPKQPRETAPTWFSKTAKVIEAKLPMKGSGDGLANTIQMWADKGTQHTIDGKQLGVSKDELKWSGLIPWLHDPIDVKTGEKIVGPITKQQVMDYLEGEGRIEVREVVKGQPEPRSNEEYTRLWKIHQAAEEELNKARPVLQEAERAVSDAEDHGKSDGDEWKVYELARQQMDARIADVNRAEQAMRLPEPETKFSQYTLPGGENYRELLFQVPGEGVTERLKTVREQLGKDRSQVSDEEYRRLVEEEKQLSQKETSEFRGGHWEEPNVFAHVRLNDRTGPNGEKILFVEELQSDWALEGRRKGFGDKVKYYVGESPEFDSRDEAEVYAARYNYPSKDIVAHTVKGTPEFSFSRNWHEVVLKRVLREAAEKGYDQVAWTTGEQQADRYDLSKHVAQVNAKRWNDSKEIGITVTDHSGNVHSMGEFPPEKLSDVVGKDLAEKIVADHANMKDQEVKAYTGLDLKIGGEWAYNLYDRMVPQFLNKYGKQWGARVGETGIEAPTQVHSLPITPSMKESVLYEGQSMFKPKETDYARRTEGDRTDTGPDHAVRNSYVPQDDHEAGRELRGFKGFVARVSDVGSWNIWKDAKDALNVPAVAGEIEAAAKNIGIHQVLWVRDSKAGGAFSAYEGKPTLILDEDVHPDFLQFVANHEMGHFLDVGRHPDAVGLVNLVDKNSPVLKAYKDYYNSKFEGTGYEIDDHAAARELVADFFAGAAQLPSGHMLKDAFRSSAQAYQHLLGMYDAVERGWKPTVWPEQIQTDQAPMMSSGKKDWWETLRDWKAGPGRPTTAKTAAHTGLLDWSRKMFAPETRTPQAMTTAQKWIESMTEARAELLRAAKTMRDYKVEFAKMGYDEAWKLSAKMERGEDVPAEWKPYTQARKEAFDATHKLISGIREGELGYIKNYAPHLYADPERAAVFFDSLGKKPLEGKKGYLKQRSLLNMDMDLARKNGLEPLFENPVIQDIAGLMEQWRYIGGDHFVKSLEKGDLFIPIKDGQPTKPVPPGWIKTDARVFRQGYAPREAIDVIHNHLISEGGNLAYVKWKNLTSFWNAMHVSFSAFHAITTMSSELGMGFAKGIPEFIGAVMTGDHGKAAEALKKIGPMGVVNAIKMGRMGKADFYNRGLHGPKVTQLVDIATKGGLLPEHTMLMAEQAADTFAELYQQMKGGEIGNAARSMLHIAGKPIMGWLVPTVKYGSTLIRLDREIEGLRKRYTEKYGPHWTPEVEANFTKDIGNISYNERQFSENIFGEIPPDNMHWDRGLAKMTKGVIAYPSWNIGTARWIGGMIRGVGEFVTGKPLDYQARLSLQFGLGLIVTIGLANTLMHMSLNNGQTPDDWKDVLIGARTGRYLNNGSAERITIASLAKDVMAIFTHPGRAILGKLQAPIAMIKELYDNADYFGTEIIPSRGTALDKVAGLGKYLGEKALPFGASNVISGKSTIAKVGGFVGLRVVPRYLANTGAMNRIDEMLQQQSPKGRTTEDSERSRKVAELKELGWNGDRQGMEEGIRAAKKEGQITDIQAGHIRQDTMKDKRVVQFRKLRNIEDALEVYEKGTPDEKKVWRLELTNKWSRATPEKRKRLRKDYEEIMAMPMSETMPERVPPRTLANRTSVLD